MVFNAEFKERGILEFRDYIGRIRGRLQIYDKILTKAVIRKYSNALAKELKSQNLTSTGKLLANTKKIIPFRRGKKKGYVIKIPLYGMYLSFAKPHWVSTTKPGRARLRKSIRRKGGIVKKYFMFRPHNWITPGMAKGRIEAKKLVSTYMKSLTKR